MLQKRLQTRLTHNEHLCQSVGVTRLLKHRKLRCTYVLIFYLFPCSITREQRLVKSSGQNDQYPFGWRVFSAWDFLITERETADNKLASLTTAIRVGIALSVITVNKYSDSKQWTCSTATTNPFSLKNTQN